MAQAKIGDTVRVHYTGTLEDGQQFDSSSGRDPLEFTIGRGAVIPGFENAVIGMAPGESRSVTIPSQEAYGDHRPEAVQEIERAQIPPGLEVEPGMRLEASDKEGHPLLVTVVEVSDSAVTLDANHPLAGEDLTFEIELVEIAA